MSVVWQNLKKGVYFYGKQKGLLRLKVHCQPDTRNHSRYFVGMRFHNQIFRGQNRCGYYPHRLRLLDCMAYRLDFYDYPKENNPSYQHLRNREKIIKQTGKRGRHGRPRSVFKIIKCPESKHSPAYYFLLTSGSLCVIVV